MFSKDLVESVKFNDDEDRVEVKIKAAYDLTKEKNLEMELQFETYLVKLKRIFF